MAKSKKTLTLYIVRRVDWEYNDEFAYRDDPRYPLDDPNNPNTVQSFLTHEKAEAYRQRLETETRSDQNPFDFGGDGSDLTDYSTLPLEAFRARVEAAGVHLPSRRSSGSYGKWYETLRKSTEAQRHAVWDALDLVRFYEVVPIQVELET